MAKHGVAFHPPAIRVEATRLLRTLDLFWSLPEQEIAKIRRDRVGWDPVQTRGFTEAMLIHVRAGGNRGQEAPARVVMTGQEDVTRISARYVLDSGPLSVSYGPRDLLAL